MPSIGRLVRYRPPAERRGDGVTVRNDTGVFEGGEISVFYDPMIAKLCTHAAIRSEAIAHMADALDTFSIDGIQHNIAFLAALMKNERWISGRLSTGFIAEAFPGGFQGAGADEAVKGRLASVAAVLDHTENCRKRRISDQMSGRPVRFSRARVVKLGVDWFDIDIQSAGDGIARVVHRGRETAERIVVSDWTPGMLVWHGRIDGEVMSVQVRRIPNGYRLSHRGVELDAHVFTPREAELAKLMPENALADTSKKLLCPMPGLVVSIDAVPGQEVKAGDSLAIVEAMKMENVLRAERDAVVKAVHARKGESLAVDAVIMEFE
jgi:propionyl-CoA carboxylase alpha chain